MAANNIINVNLFGQEIGRIGIDETGKKSSFQYNPEYLKQRELQNIFPATGIIKRTEHVQLFSQFDVDTFKGILPQFADSLPDMFGSIIFKAWLDSREQKKISVLEQLAYVGKRGVGALEYSPVVQLPENVTIDINEIIEILRQVLDLKKVTNQNNLDSQALLNIFKIGTSAGGARPKILISENKLSGEIIPGDLEISNKYNHYLVKLAIDDNTNYPREIIEYCYHLILKKIEIRMMDCKLIDHQHFATLRYDRQEGKKKHVLTATGITGWDFKDPNHSSYENLFKLCSFLKIPHVQIVELFKRMVFNIIYRNTDDHLKNHSFIYNMDEDSWDLSPAYDITYALNPLVSFKKVKRALSINGKRSNIDIHDVLKIADDYTISNPKGMVREIQSYKEELLKLFAGHDVPSNVSNGISESIVQLM